MKIGIGLAFGLATLATATASHGQVAPPGTIPGVFDPSTRTFTPLDAAGPRATPDSDFNDGTFELSIAMAVRQDFDPLDSGDETIEDAFGRLFLDPTLGRENKSSMTESQFITNHVVTTNTNFALGDKNPTTTVKWAYQPSGPGKNWFNYTATIHAYDKHGNYHSFSYAGQGPLPKNGEKITIHGSL